MDITQLLAFSVKNKASDLHLSAGLPPMIRVHGDVRRINVESLDHKAVHAMVYDIMNDTQRKVFEEFLEIDFSFEIEGLARFRVNAFNHQRGAGAVFRTIPSKILTLEQLHAPKIFSDLALKPRGMVLVTGPTGSGILRRAARKASKVSWLKPNCVAVAISSSRADAGPKCRAGEANLDRDRGPVAANRREPTAGAVYPTEPSICSWIRRFISTAYSIGSSLTSGSMKPLTIMVLASASLSPRLIR